MREPSRAEPPAAPEEEHKYVINRKVEEAPDQVIDEEIEARLRNVAL